MFLRMIRGVLMRQRGKMLMIAFTIALGASLATAMLNVMMDVEDKVNQELKAYGANITVVSKEASMLSDLYDVSGDADTAGAYLREDELGNIKTIFWAFNIVDFAPFIDTTAKLNGHEDVRLVGTWFNHHMDLPTGETLDTGIQNLRSWWDVTDGAWLDEQAANSADVCMVGALVAEREGIGAGDVINVATSYGTRELTVVGVFDAGGDEDAEVFAPMDMVQELSNTDGRLTSIEVSALTTPDNELARKAAKDPSSLSIAQYETWYCTAYASSICYQIQEVITDSVAAPVRQIAESEGAILDKTKLLMILITVLALIGSALGISNLVTASVMERSQEIGLLKAIGAHDGMISRLVLTEIIITAIIGGIIGYFAGIGFAQIVGHSVFGSAIDIKLMIIPIVAILVVAVTLAGSIPAVRMVLRLEPAEVLHGR
ncbi:MAG: ABC transporter permease [Clostridia bacterium]|nr:ABC transporter permease [Clostridia bacterium]MBQ1376020.1 ABC transporter permease [Clostridia bacterium]MBQ1434695.1 ABC transporter permease [Clostridia bacterium]